MSCYHSYLYGDLYGHEFKRVKKTLNSLMTSTNIGVTNGEVAVEVERRNSPYISRHKIRYWEHFGNWHIADCGFYVMNERYIIGVIEGPSKFEEHIIGHSVRDLDDLANFKKGALEEMIKVTKDFDFKFNECFKIADKWDVIYVSVPTLLLQSLIRQICEYLPVFKYDYVKFTSILVPIPIPVAWYDGKPIFTMEQVERIRNSQGEDAVRVVE